MPSRLIDCGSEIPVSGLTTRKSDFQRPLDSVKNCQKVQLSPQIASNDLERLIEEYLLDCDLRFHSKATIAGRRVFLRNLVWFLRHRAYPSCGTLELKQFFHYVANGHEEPGGRWGQAHYNKPVRPVTIKDYWVNVNCLFNWLVEEGLLEASPMQRIPKPRVPNENVEPFTAEQIGALIQAARQSKQPCRDEAIVLFLLDTGVRAAELCTLTCDALYLQTKSASVLGKGNKRRIVYFSRKTAAALAMLIRLNKLRGEDEVFTANHGAAKGQALTVNGLRQIIERLVKAAGIKGRKKSTHTFRHTCALMMLKNGCNIYALKELLGHSSLTTCQIYLKLSQADVQTHHQRYGAVDNLKV